MANQQDEVVAHSITQPAARRGGPGGNRYELRVAALGIYQAVLALALVAFIFALWPETVTDGSGQTGWRKTVQIGPYLRELSDDARLILLVLCTGALGSYVHSATSFVSYVGNRALVFSWVWWYLLRPFIGMALALIFYFVIRGGLMATSAQPDEINPFGVAAVAGLVGMFSKQAADKLRELFDNLFRTESGQGDDARANKLGANRPVAGEMIDRRKITAFIVPEGKTEEDVPVADLHRMLGGIVTRIPVLDHNGAVKCVIHQSLLYKYLADEGIAAAKEGRSFQAGQYSLRQFLDAPGTKELVQDSLCFIPIGATLAEAKDRMEKTKHCQDVFVTEHGQSGEPVLGWLTDGELLRYSKV